MQGLNLRPEDYLPHWLSPAAFKFKRCGLDYLITRRISGLGARRIVSEGFLFTKLIPEILDSYEFI